MERFTQWTLNLNPDWIGTVIFVSTVLMLVIATAFILGFLLSILGFLLSFWPVGIIRIVGFLIIGLVSYAWYLALFNQ